MIVPVPSTTGVSAVTSPSTTSLHISEPRPVPSHSSISTAGSGRETSTTVGPDVERSLEVDGDHDRVLVVGGGGPEVRVAAAAGLRELEGGLGTGSAGAPGTHVVLLAASGQRDGQYAEQDGRELPGHTPSDGVGPGVVPALVS